MKVPGDASLVMPVKEKSAKCAPNVFNERKLSKQSTLAFRCEASRLNEQKTARDIVNLRENSPDASDRMTTGLQPVSSVRSRSFLRSVGDFSKGHASISQDLPGRGSGEN